MDFLEAFVQFITDLFSALGEFLGNSSFSALIEGIGEVSEVVNDATAGSNTDAG